LFFTLPPEEDEEEELELRVPDDDEPEEDGLREGDALLEEPLLLDGL
jgi:hypothetical protein